MKTRRKRTMLLAVAATAPVVALASCGSDGEPQRFFGLVGMQAPDAAIDGSNAGFFDASSVDAGACADVMGRCDPNPPPDAEVGD
jgi:hypothetical protein